MFGPFYYHTLKKKIPAHSPEFHVVAGPSTALLQHPAVRCIVKAENPPGGKSYVMSVLCGYHHVLNLVLNGLLGER